MSIHVMSVFIGFIVLPGMAATWWAGRWARTAMWRRIRSSVPSNAGSRAVLAARVYSGQRVLVLRFRETTLGVTLGRSFSDEQRARDALSQEFTPPARAARIKGRTW